MNLPSRVPRATYRLQLHADFTFEKLARIVPYLSELGISDVYLSPIFRAAPGSTHGYDVCDHNEVNPELGGRDGLAKLSVLLQEHKMGMLLDFVPNHMGIEGPCNWRWMDVLENGRLSSFASFFDIQWNPRQTALQDRILVPLLHDFYGRVLEAGEIRIEWKDVTFWANYRSLRFPLCPESYGIILHDLAWLKNPGSPLSHELEKLAAQFRALPKPATPDSADELKERNRRRNRLRQELAELIADEKLDAELDQVLKNLNGDPEKPESFDRLHQLLEEQNYRLAYWKTGTHEINYRRFFAIDTLVGVRMGAPEVFEESHRLLKELLEQGIATGARIDHIDGLWNPAQYLERLSGLAAPGGKPFYSLVEKILTEKEEMPADWMTHGTTGYDFAGSLINVLIASRSENEFTRIYREFAGITIKADEQAYRIKLYIMDELFPNALDNFALDLEARIKSDRRWRDWTVSDLRPALSRIIACLSVYRTYRIAGQPPVANDIDVVERAVAEALRRNYSSDPLPYHFIRDLWTGRYPDEKAGAELKTWADDWICKLQQYTGAIMAKSVEDTFFYRYVRLFAANEVGHHPAEFGRPLADFHEDNRKRLRDWPASMLATSTHDTKMSEDVRARLLALSEIPASWDTALHRWSKLNHVAKKLVNNMLAPDPNEEYLLYQILLGAWPLEKGGVDEAFRERIKAYMRKALSESKARTNWANPDEEWMKAGDSFIDAILDPKASALFWEDFVPFAERLAERGLRMSLVQVALKLTSPGVPDFYQGTELWDFSLVDPDNRRPIDYDLRQNFLPGLDTASVPELLASWKDGRIKMRLIRALLRFRREQPDLFLRGGYTPLSIAGPHADRFISFLRQDGASQLLVVALRRRAEDDVTDLKEICANSKLVLSDSGSVWRELLTGREVNCVSKEIPLDVLFDLLPVSIFVAKQEALVKSTGEKHA
jgi:(1->4)-alpha-D-glucan 1-alpha-D-glucosylmutase